MLGAAAAQRLGIDRVYPGERIWLGGMWFYVAGILNPAVLAPEIDSSVLIGFPAAETYLDYGASRRPPGGRQPDRDLRARADEPGRRRRQRARRDRQPREPERGRRQPALRRARRRSRRQGRVQRPLPRPRRRRAARRRDRRRQHHDHLACSSAAPRSACAARSARPRPRSAPSSSPRRSCSRCLGGAAGIGAGALATAIYAHTKHWATVDPRRSPGPAARRRDRDRRDRRAPARDPRRHGSSPTDALRTA